MLGCSVRVTDWRSSAASSEVREVDGSGFLGGDAGTLIFRWAACDGSVTAATLLVCDCNATLMRFVRLLPCGSWDVLEAAIAYKRSVYLPVHILYDEISLRTFGFG